MAQHDYVIDNSTGANVRADINSVLQAIASNNSGSSAPSSTFALQFYADTTNNILKLRNAANDGFINLFTLAGGVDVDAASNFNEDVTFTGASANIVFDKSDNALEFADNAELKVGTDGDLTINHTGSHTFISQNGTGDLFIRQFGSSNSIILGGASSEKFAQFIHNSAVELYHDNSKKFETTSSGINIIGMIDTTENIDIDADNQALRIGASQTFQLVFTGSEAIIKNVGATSPIKIKVKDGVEDAIVCNANGSVDLYNDNTKRFETTSSGVKVSNGDLFLDDNQKIKLGDSNDLQIYHSGSHSHIQDAGTGNLRVQTNNLRIENAAGSENQALFTENGAVELYHDNSKKLETTSGGINVTGAITVNGSALSAGGKLLQVQYDEKTDKFSSTSSSFVTVTGLSVSITPASSSNKILVRAVVSCGMGGGGIDAFIRLIRDTDSGATTLTNEQCIRQSGSQENFTWVLEELDSPNTTSTITYKIQGKTGSNEFFINRDGGNQLLGQCSITAMEID